MPTERDILERLDERLSHGITPNCDLLWDALAEIERLRAMVAWRPQWRHVKRGTEYMVIGRASLQASTGNVGEAAMLVVYRDEKGRLFARDEAEFDDGRFEPLTPPPAAPGDHADGGADA